MDSKKKEYAEFVVKHGAFRVGEFIFKSGRKAPNMVNTGWINDGEGVKQLGTLYAETIQRSLGIDFDVLFGPAYKGIPLAVTCASAFAEQGINKGFSFDRKEAKDHAEGGTIVGTQLKDGMRVVMVDDVITDGGTKIEAVQKLKQIADVTVVGIVILVDREEVTSEGRNAIKDLEEKLGLKVVPILTMSEIREHLEETKQIDEETLKKMDAYAEQYGIQNAT